MDKTVIFGAIGLVLMSGVFISAIYYKKQAIRWREQCYAGHNREVKLELELDSRQEA